MVGLIFGVGDVLKLKKRNYEYIGSLNPAIAKRWNLNEHANKPIVIYSNVRQHVIDRHIKEFKNEEEIDLIWSKLRMIIKKPDEVFYNEITKGLEYYKRFDKEIVIAVRINFSSILKVKSFYVANKGKMKNRMTKEQQMIDNGELEDIFN